MPTLTAEAAQRTPSAPAHKAALRLTDLHFANRFGAGYSPEIAKAVAEAGGGRAWFAQQLKPRSLADPLGDRVDTWFRSLSRSPKRIFDRERDDVQGAWEVMYDLSRWTVSRRIHSSRQVKETMVDFWSNLLNVPLMDDEAWYFRVEYDKVIRKYALDSFESLLLHTTVHPAMGLFLDNAVSTKRAPNENLGRELMELHTVGVDGGYTEADVKASSKLLTGYRVDLWWPKFQSFYDPEVHYTGPLQIMGFTHPNTNQDGRAATRAYLRYLAHHPSTAQRLARRLCVKFVNDNPSADLVATVKAAYLANGTAIRPTLRALVDHPEFVASYAKKVRMPSEDYVATTRALRIQLERPQRGGSFANDMYWQYVELGQAPYEWPAPNGYPEVSAAWTSAGRVLNGLELHLTLAAKWWPTEEARFRKPAAWLPDLPATLGEVVDHMCVQLLGREPTDDVRRGIATVLELPLSRLLSKGDLWSYRIQCILASLLDSPLHLYR